MCHACSFGQACLCDLQRAISSCNSYDDIWQPVADRVVSLRSTYGLGDTGSASVFDNETRHLHCTCQANGTRNINCDRPQGGLSGEATLPKGEGLLGIRGLRGFILIGCHAGLQLREKVVVLTPVRAGVSHIKQCDPQVTHEAGNHDFAK